MSFIEQRKDNKSEKVLLNIYLNLYSFNNNTLK